MNQSTALVIILDGIEELETIAPIDCLRRAGVAVTVASAGPSLTVTGRNNIKITADTFLDAGGEPFDLVVIPGGPSHVAMAGNQVILDILREQDAAGRLIGSICAGPVVLQKAGILDGKAFTSFPSTQEALPARDPIRTVVRDANLITSQGAGTAIEFALALVEATCGAEIAGSIGQSICHQD